MQKSKRWSNHKLRQRLRWVHGLAHEMCGSYPPEEIKETQQMVRETMRQVRMRVGR